MSSTLGYLRQAREWAYPTLKTSAFLEKGVLTPEEFVLAGDELVFRCPTWAWEAGDPKKLKSYLPPDKQYLITRNVPCQTRVASMENHIAAEGDDEEGDWLVSSIIQQKDRHDDEIGDDFDILDEEGEVLKVQDDTNMESVQSNANNNTNSHQEEDEYADMADFEDDNVIQDDAAVAAATTGTTSTATSTATTNDMDNLIKVRTYDLSITYDKYYQTPRVWMVGKSAEGQPLSGKAMMEDVISDYANRTVTIESHPHVAGPHASIHPCQHGKVMKAIVRNLIKSSTKHDGEEEEEMTGPSVEMYIFIFLKFVSSIIPTINYDFTMDVTADTSK